MGRHHLVPIGHPLAPHNTRGLPLNKRAGASYLLRARQFLPPATDGAHRLPDGWTVQVSACWRRGQGGG
jgi:hypothetical protein